MKLYRVVAECEFYFLSEEDDGEEPSHEDQESALEEAVSDAGLLYDFSPIPVDSIDEVPESERDSVPYGAKTPGDMSIREHFAKVVS